MLPHGCHSGDSKEVLNTFATTEAKAIRHCLERCKVVMFLMACLEQCLRSRDVIKRSNAQEPVRLQNP